jgi:hypothetical protein
MTGIEEFKIGFTYVKEGMVRVVPIQVPLFQVLLLLFVQLRIRVRVNTSNTLDQESIDQSEVVSLKSVETFI